MIIVNHYNQDSAAEASAIKWLILESKIGI